MTRRITFLFGVTCAVLLLVALLGGCGDDEDAGPPRTVPESTGSGTESRSTETAEDPATNPEDELCFALLLAATRIPTDLSADDELTAVVDLLQLIEPHTDGQLREDINLVLSAAQAEQAGRSWPWWRTPEIRAAGDRIEDVIAACGARRERSA